MKPSVTVHLVHHPGSGSVYRERTKHATAAVTAKSLNNGIRGSIGNIHTRRRRLRLHKNALSVKTDNRIVASWW